MSIFILCLVPKQNLPYKYPPKLQGREEEGVEVDIIKKDRKPSQNDKTEHGMEKTVQNQGQSLKMPKSESILKRIWLGRQCLCFGSGVLCVPFCSGGVWGRCVIDLSGGFALLAGRRVCVVDGCGGGGVGLVAGATGKLLRVLVLVGVGNFWNRDGLSLPFFS
ncbi:hypothetical protein Tco_0846066 [Tanacetum coccineum]